LETEAKKGNATAAFQRNEGKGEGGNTTNHADVDGSGRFVPEKKALDTALTTTGCEKRGKREKEGREGCRTSGGGKKKSPS